MSYGDKIDNGGLKSLHKQNRYTFFKLNQFEIIIGNLSS